MSIVFSPENNAYCKARVTRKEGLRGCREEPDSPLLSFRKHRPSLRDPNDSSHSKERAGTHTVSHIMCVVERFSYRCCGHVYRTELVERCDYFSWEYPCETWKEDIAERVLKDCPSCRLDHEGRLAEISREYRSREAAANEAAKRFDWPFEFQMERVMTIISEMEDAQERLCQLSGLRSSQ